MRIFSFSSGAWIAKPLGDVFPSFSEARNLEELTPDWLRFQVLTPPPIEMAIGAKIDYRLRLRGIPIEWECEITAWEPPYDSWTNRDGVRIGCGATSTVSVKRME